MDVYRKMKLRNTAWTEAEANPSLRLHVVLLRTFSIRRVYKNTHRSVYVQQDTALTRS